MKTWIALSLAFLLPAVGASAPETATVTVHRCVDSKEHVTLQDDPCPKGSTDSKIEMTRPKDPPPRPDEPAPPPPAVVEIVPEDYPPPRQWLRPPPMFRCTSYDGDERYSEQYDPNPRCEPFVLYYPYPNSVRPTEALSCRWVEDSCVRLTDQAACARWIDKRKEAASAVLHAFSDTAAYRKSELARLNQIIDESCP